MACTPTTGAGLMHIPLPCVVLLLGSATASYAAADNEKFDPVHHTANGYYLDFSPIGKVELPRIFVIRTAGGGFALRAYRNTRAALYSRDFVATSGKTPSSAPGEAPHPPDDVESLIRSGHHLDAHLAPVRGRVIIDLSLTRHLVFAFLAAGLLLWTFIAMARRYARGTGRTSAPRGLLQNTLELLIVFIRDDIAIPNMGRTHYKRFLPFLLTVFFFIVTCNLLGLVPWGATASSNINITAALALFTFVLTQINGSKSYWRHIFWPPGMPVAVKVLLIPTEIMGIFIKPVVLAIRLFANMTAGHLVILSLIGMIFTFSSLFGPVGGYGVAPVAVGFTLFINVLELLIAFIQAYIFTFLSALFIGMAMAEHEHAEAH